MRQLLYTLALCLSGTTATAQLCDGQYDRAAQLIDETYSRYGTLYSGGRLYGTVGPTLEIYRMLSGLPDAGMSTADRWPQYGTVDPAGDRRDPNFAGETLLRSLPRIHDPDFRKVTAEGATDSEVLLNMYTPIGPYPGWWLTPDAPHLSPVERVIATYAVDDALDWLLTVQAASARPSSISWHLSPNSTPPAIATVIQHAAERFTQTEDLTWMLAYLVVSKGYWYWPRTQETSTAREMANERYDTLKAGVADCSATSADYVAFSIATLQRLRDFRPYNPATPENLANAEQIPASLRVLAATQVAKRQLSRPYYDQQATPDDLRHMANDPTFDRWLNVGLSYRASDLDELITIHEGIPLDQKVFRLLNLLPADDLETFARSRADFDVEYRDLLTVTFLRRFALGRDGDAAAMVAELLPLWPDQQEAMEEAWNGSRSLGYRLAQVALALPEPRVLVAPMSAEWRSYYHTGIVDDDFALRQWLRVRRSRDLPIYIRSGGFLSRDLEIWYETVSAAPFLRNGPMRRMWRRGIVGPDVLYRVDPVIPERARHYRANPGFSAMIASNELAQLGPETGLANRIGRELVLNARAETDGFVERFFADHERLALDMELVIQQGRRMIHGEIDGKPLGQAAFAVLHGPLQDTEVTARTPYWFICRERCEP